jgi:RNase P subunit RPR2
MTNLIATRARDYRGPVYPPGVEHELCASCAAVLVVDKELRIAQAALQGEPTRLVCLDCHRRAEEAASEPRKARVAAC